MILPPPPACRQNTQKIGQISKSLKIFLLPYPKIFYQYIVSISNKPNLLMASPDLELSCPSSTGHLSFSGSFNMSIEETNPAKILPALEVSSSSLFFNCNIPKPPPLPTPSYMKKYPNRLSDCCCIPKETMDVWENLFKEGYGADVYIIAENDSYISVHSDVLNTVSPVLWNRLQQSKSKGGLRYIKIPGVPYEAVNVFICFLYSSCYEIEEMKKFVLHLLVLSHSYVVPLLKRVCIQFLEQGWVTKDNVVDVLQLARNCDAPQLSLLCVRMIVKDFKAVSSTDGWKVMKRANPALELELLKSVVEPDSRRQEMEDRKVYLLLYEAMEALLHICRDGCRTIGPHDKVLKGSQVACGFRACKGLETLVRHFSSCKTRVPRGCVHCKRMWQLLELHSRMCKEPDTCKVPLCRHFKEKMLQQSKKDEKRWQLLVSKVVAAKNAPGLRPIKRSGYSSLS